MIRTATDLAECQRLWERVAGDGCLFDLWDVRACFQRHYGHAPRFLVDEAGGRVRGFCPLSEISDCGYLGFFPGETYHGKTWLEQNPLTAETPELLAEMLAEVPGPAHLRYLPAECVEGVPGADVDEVGFLFRPGEYGYRFDNYLGAFSGKSRKRLGREMDAFTNRGVEFRYDEPADVDRAFGLNLAAFGEQSYFADDRFLESFRSLADLLRVRGMLRVTAVLVAGRLAAVDVGAVYHNVYTVLGGGTDVEFPGIAKLINFHHIEWACSRRVEEVDFLCGDFGWKSRFHLTPRPLHQIRVSCDEVPTRRDEVAADVV